MANVRIKDLSTTAATTASDDFFGVDGATNGTRKLNAYSPTFGGNLTVSGTGNNVFNASGGNILVGGASDLGPKLQVAAARGNAATSGTTQAGMLRLTPNDGGSGTLDMGIRTAGGYAWLQVSDRTDLSINYAMLLQPNGGNVLIGTTTNTGQKLQVNGSAIIGSTSFEEFGTDGTAQFYAASGGTAQLTLTSGGAYDWRIRGRSTSMTIVRDNTDMLSFDTSSNATFAGKTYTASGTAAAPAISFSGDTDSGFYNPGGNQVSLACGGGQIWNTTVNGLSMASGKDIYLGNAYQAATVVPTGYVTIKDSTGTVYKVCVLL